MEYYDLVIYVLVFVIAFLYASVGHGGASGYLALMALYGFAPEQMKSTALILNIAVSCIAFIPYYRKGHFISRLFIPLALASVPMAFVGGWLMVNESVFRLLLGILLLLASLRFSGLLKIPEKKPIPVSPSLLFAIGAGIGLVSGMTGIGGGIILSPLLLLLGWASIKEAAAVSALFILVNSLAGFGGLAIHGIPFDQQALHWLGVAMAGGFIGATFGAFKFGTGLLTKILALVLVIASFKLIFT